jgi:F-box and WD-40 domain protein CDC4
LNTERLPALSSKNVTCVALNLHWVVVGFEDGPVRVFYTKTGMLSRVFMGHVEGVWAVHLVNKGNDPQHPYPNTCCASEGWGQPNSHVLSAGRDKIVRVWDARTG